MPGLDALGGIPWQVKSLQKRGKDLPLKVSSAKMSDEEVPTSNLQFRRTISAFSFQIPDPPTLKKTTYKSKHSELSLPTKTRASAKRISSKGKCNQPILLQDYFEPDLDSMPSLSQTYIVRVTDQFRSRILWN